MPCPPAQLIGEKEKHPLNREMLFHAVGKKFQPWVTLPVSFARKYKRTFLKAWEHLRSVENLVSKKPRGLSLMLQSRKTPDMGITPFSALITANAKTLRNQISLERIEFLDSQYMNFKADVNTIHSPNSMDEASACSLEMARKEAL